MSRDRGRKGFYSRDRDRDWDRLSSDYRSGRSGGRILSRKRSRSLTRGDLDKRRSRTPRKNEKDGIDDNILSEIAKLPEPSELWDNNQYQDGGYSAPPPPSFQREPSTQNYGTTYQPTYAGIYDDFPPLASAPQHPPDMASWNQMALPPPPPVPSYHNPEDQLKKEAAIESEMRQQKAALSKQREDYIKKSAILKKELDTLKDQRNELRGDAKRSPSPDTKRFLKENTKLQLEIQNKLKTINNVVDMLNGIIGEEAQELHESDDSPERKRKSRSPSANKKFNYVYYDPEMHWCRVCNEFPPTAKDYLNHLHSAAHHKMAAQHMEAPWHSVSGVNEGFPSLPSAPTKRTPIRGLQFFVPSTAWYCKLCDQFIGDLHCASAHLKSVVHSKNYTNFVEQNPHWETDWMSDRQKAFEKARAGAGSKLKPAEEKPPYAAHTITFSKDGFHTKRPKKSPSPQPEEKKKKKDKKKKSKKKRESSSSSSSRSESSDSVRSEPKKKKKDKPKKLKNIDVTDDKALEEWVSNIQMDKLTDSDRKLLDSLKIRIKKERSEKQKSTSRDIERVTEMQRKIRERSRATVRRGDSRERRGDSHERRGNSRERRGNSRERRGDSHERRGNSRERREDSRERHEDSREHHEDSRERRERWDRRAPRDEQPDKKPEIKKMPFIGKMPVYKHLGKTKAEEQKKEEQKKKEEIDMEKKRQEMDAEIQRKVAEFKQKIARAQLDRQPPPPPLALPPALAAPAPPPPPPVHHTPHTHTHAHPASAQPPPAAAATPALPKDFQEALDIIFPTDPATCTEKLQQELFTAMQPGILGMPPYQPMGMMQPGMFGFDLNPGLFPQPQLYDSHVPLLPAKPRQKQKPPVRKKNFVKERIAVKKELSATEAQTKDSITAAAKKKEEMDDLAMLGIDASDVGAGI